MDIVANSLSVGKLRTGDVTVRGQPIIDWFESKLSAAVSFVGVFETLDDAPKKNGAIAIVGSKDYIYSSDANAWQEIGDEGQIGVILKELSECIKLSTLDDYATLSTLSDYVQQSSLTGFATDDEGKNYGINLSSNGEAYVHVPWSGSAEIPDTYKTYNDTISALTSESGFKTYAQTSIQLSNDGYLTKASADIDYQAKGDYAKTSDLSDLSVEINQNIPELSVDNIKVKDFKALHISQDDYYKLVISEQCDPHTIYIISSDNINAYGEKITNVTDATDLSDAVPFGQLNTILTDYAKTSDIPQKLGDLSNDVGYLSAETEPGFAAISSTFLTQTAFSNILSGITYDYNDNITWMASALYDIISKLGGTIQNFPPSNS